MAAPGLAQVVASGSTPAYLSLIKYAAVFSVAFLAVLTAARGYTAIRKRPWSPAEIAEGPSLAEIEFGEKEEKYKFFIAELKREKEKLVLRRQEAEAEKEQLVFQNTLLQTQLKGREERRQIEDVLRKSNIALAKENERLKTEKEELVLKAAGPLIKAKIQKTKKARPPRVAAPARGRGK